MLITFTLIFISLLLFLGLKTLGTASCSGSYAGRRTLSKISRWKQKRIDIWTVFPIKQLLALTSRIVYVDDGTAANLRNQLSKAGLNITPQEFSARKVVIVIFCAGLAALCFAVRFYFGIVVALLFTAYALMKQRDALSAKVKKKEQAIAQEMPRFARTLCRMLLSERDLIRVIGSYRKVAGSELGAELDILLAEMKTGNIQNALAHFENRLGTAEAFRLCAALRDMSMGVDQTAALSYMADDMARQAKENIKIELSLRPGKMRRTYYPAIAVCIAMVLYVLVVYVINNLNSIM